MHPCSIPKLIDVFKWPDCRQEKSQPTCEQTMLMESEDQDGSIPGSRDDVFVCSGSINLFDWGSVGILGILGIGFPTPGVSGVALCAWVWCEIITYIRRHWVYLQFFSPRDHELSVLDVNLYVPVVMYPYVFSYGLLSIRFFLWGIVHSIFPMGYYPYVFFYGVLFIRFFYGVLSIRYFLWAIVYTFFSM